jgi:AcrR family transcriptional regulator
MSGKPSRIPAADRREQIIGVAMRLFADKGFRGTTTREIAMRARVNEAILFRHFPHKEDLYWAVVEAKCRGPESRKELRALLKSATPREAMTAVAEEILRRNMEDPSLTRIFLYTALENHELSHRLFRTYALRYYEILEDYIRVRIRSGEFRRVNPQLAARSFLGMVVQHYQAQELFGGKRYQKFDPHQVSETLTDIWLGGLRAVNGKRARKRRSIERL